MATIEELTAQAPKIKIVPPTKGDIQEIKALGSPPVLVLTVCRLALTLLHGSEHQEASWAECKKAFANPAAAAHALQQLSGFDISSRDPYLIQLLIQLID